MSENATCCSCGKSGINPDKHRCIPELKEELNEWQRQVCGQGEVISLLNDKLFTANATIAAFNAKVIHCEKCGSSWYDDGFTPSCPSCTIAALKAENERLEKAFDAELTQSRIAVEESNELSEEVERLEKAFDAALTQSRIAVEESNELSEEVERLKAKLDRSHLYRNSSYWQEKAMAVLRGEFTQCCSYCGFEAQPPNGWEELQKHIEECPEHPLPKLRARAEQAEKELAAEREKVERAIEWLNENIINYCPECSLEIDIIDWDALEQILQGTDK